MKFIDKYRRKKKEKRLIKDIETTRQMLRRIDVTMQALNMPRWKRKQIWSGFIKSQDQRMNVLSILEGAKP